MIPVCWTVPCDTRDKWDMLDDDSLMEAVTADGQNMYKLYQRVVSLDEEDCCDSDVADLECLTFLGKDCIMDFSAGGTVSPSVSDLSGPRGPYVTDGPVGHLGTLSSSTFKPAILVDPGGTLPSSDLAGMLPPAIPVGPVGRWGTLPPSISDPAGPEGPSVTGGPVGHLGTLSSSTFEPAILVDPGGTLPSSDLAGMLLPAIPVCPVGIWGTLSLSDSDPAGQDGPYVTGGPVDHLGTLSPSTSTSEILVDPGGMSPSSDLAEMRGPAPPAESAVLRGPVGPAVSSETLLPGVDVPGLCRIVLTVGLWPGVAVPLPAVWDPLFASSLVEKLKVTGADVVGRSRAVRVGRSGPDVAGTSAVVDLGAALVRAVECLAWDGGGRREMVDDRTIYELTIYELLMVVVYIFCVDVLLCSFRSQGFSQFASLSGVIPLKLVWGIVRSFLGFEHVHAGGGGGGSVTIVQYRSGLGWPTIGVVSVMAHRRYGM